MTNVMLDLETLGTRPGCAILSIGAVTFGKQGVSLLDRFESHIYRGSCLDAGLVEDAATLAWWNKQVDSRIVSTCADASRSAPLGDVLCQFAAWLTEVCSNKKDLRVWGNGADFDLPILSEAYRHCGMNVPWPAYSGRCYRTLKNLIPNITLVRTGQHHDALSDAVSQAEHAVRLLNEIEEY